MKGFEPVTLTWGGASYTVPADKQLMLIAKIEDALESEGSDPAIWILFRKGGVRLTKLAAALGAALRYAGADVSDGEIYLELAEDAANFSKSDATMRGKILVASLLAIIAPPVMKKAAEMGSAATAKKPQAAAS